MTTPKLFAPITLGGASNPIHLQHRVVMAPLTRLRAASDGRQEAIAATYYGQRATPGGLLIAEGSNVSATARGLDHSPGLFTDAQIDAWKPVTAAVHAKQGVIFAQLWHNGRIGHASLHPNGEVPVSSTANHPAAFLQTSFPLSADHALVTPARALRTDEIPAVCRDFQHAARNALAAGFDGVEVNAANGHLLEQFLYDEINDRTDAYGGSIANRARFLMQVVQAITTEVDASRVGVRLSPFSTASGQKMTRPVEDSTYMLRQLGTMGLAYVHLVEPRGFHDGSALAPVDGITPLLRVAYPGVLITASGYEQRDAEKIVENGQADLVAFGRPFIANPDLVERFRRGAVLNELDPSTLFLAGSKGYIDYPFLETP